jgi:regulator of replication initiation timing
VERQRAKESQTLQAQAAELAAENECLRVELERLRAERDR